MRTAVKYRGSLWDAKRLAKYADRTTVTARAWLVKVQKGEMTMTACLKNAKKNRDKKVGRTELSFRMKPEKKYAHGKLYTVEMVSKIVGMSMGGARDRIRAAITNPGKNGPRLLRPRDERVEEASVPLKERDAREKKNYARV